MYVRKLPAIVILISLLVLAFGVGYVAYPLLNPAGDVGQASTEEPVVERNDSTPAEMQVFWEAWHLLERDFFGEKPDETVRTYGALRGLTESFDDGYTFFVEPQPRELERDDLRGSFGGIGAYIEASEEGYILRPMPGQPADLAGVIDGDLVLVVDDREVPPDMSVDELVSLVRGPVGTEVVLVLRRPGEDGEDPVELTVTIVRAEIETPSVVWEVIGDAGEPPVGYIQHSFFSERSPEEMQSALEELAAADVEGLVLDLRGNPGGLVTSAVAVAGFWLDGGPILIEERADGSREVFEADAGAVEPEAPLVVIVDAASASASEIVAGALQDRERALLVGQPTFGKGSVQLIHELSDASSLHITNAEWFTPDGHAISGTGLAPDVVVSEDEDPLAVAVDEILRMLDAR